MPFSFKFWDKEQSRSAPKEFSSNHIDERSPLIVNRNGGRGDDCQDFAADGLDATAPNPYDPMTNEFEAPQHEHSFTKRLLRFRAEDNLENPPIVPRRKGSRRGQRHGSTGGVNENTHLQSGWAERKDNEGVLNPKPGLGPRPVGGTEKLGTFSGVFVPTCLNVLSILMFLRFGFILGQAGILGIMGMLIASYLINLVTTFSLSAIASNGTVRGGGAYYLISRSLGPEFGGSIGVVFYMGFAFNTGLNAVGLVDCVKQNVGRVSGNWYNWLPEGQWYEYLWATIVLLICTGICLGGSGMFARASNGLLVILLIATFSIPFSALVMSPWEDRKLGIYYTGISLDTFRGNMMPMLTRGAAGSQLKGKETFQDLFGILFPATGGIMAGASMSGDLQHPSKAIPKGTLYGLGLTFVAYTLVILAMAATITRTSFVHNVNVIQDTNLSGLLILSGEFASAFFSTLMGVIGSAKLLQALARDKLLPGFSVFGQGTSRGDEPTYAILFTYMVAQLIMLADINQIASFVTMTYLMTFLVMNLATFLLEIGSAPNFRPSFHFFSWETALAGAIISGGAMFFVDGVYATGCVVILILLFLLIHYTTPPRSWGDVSQSLIYHQVRKYLLRLRPEHVKFWRPQILLLVNDPRRQYRLIQFCNSMKKGALYILGHVIISQDFGEAVPEARRQQLAWTSFISLTKVKAFVSVNIAPSLEWGVRTLVLGTGLGGMRPNIAVLGFYNMSDLSHSLSQDDSTKKTGGTNGDHDGNLLRSDALDNNSRYPQPAGDLPTDACRSESIVNVMSYVTLLEDLLLRLQINVALAKGFQNLEFPHPAGQNSKRYIDLWPIQMSAEIASEGDQKTNVLTTNFDTYTLILQLGCILNTVPAWKKVYKLRVAVFVEYEADVEEEKGRVKELLSNLRIEAEVLVFWLASGELPSYEVIVNGQSPGLDAEREVEDCLSGQDWWDDIQRIRGNREDAISPSHDLTDVTSIFTAASAWPESSFQQGPRNERAERFLGLRKLLKKSKRRHTMSGLSRLGVSLGMRTQNLHPRLVNEHPSNMSASEDSESSSSDDTDVFEDDDAGSVGKASVVSEGDVDDYRSEDDDVDQKPVRIMRRRSHGDSLRGPPMSRKATGQQEAHIAEQSPRERLAETSAITSREGRPQSSGTASSKATSISNLTASITAQRASAANAESASEAEITPRKLEERFSALRQTPTKRPSMPLGRPSLSRHASMPKFSSKPVPATKVATDDGPGPSIMFAATPSPPNRRQRLPSAYYSRQASSSDHFADGISEVSETEEATSRAASTSRRGSTYSTQGLPLSFNDLPCRAQHFILNELIRSQSRDTAVMFTTLPSPVEGTGKSEEASISYLSDLEVLCKGCPPCLLVHSNSMTVTVSL